MATSIIFPEYLEKTVYWVTVTVADEYHHFEDIPINIFSVFFTFLKYFFTLNKYGLFAVCNLWGQAF